MPPKGRKKGLSDDEKKVKLLEFFTKEHTFYNIKEVESLGSKYVGVHSMQIKEILTSLIDDGLINSEKCGVTFIYWCFEYDKLKKVKDMYEKKQQRLKTLQDRKSETKDSLELEGSKRTNVDRMQTVRQIEKLKEENQKLSNSLKSDDNFCVSNINNLRQILTAQRDNADTYAENLECLIYHFDKKYNIQRDFFSAEFGIPEEFKELPSVEKLFDEISKSI